MKLPLDWLSSTFGLGAVQAMTPVTRGQNSPFELLRVETDRGAFTVKRFIQPPRPVGLAVEAAAVRAGFPMSQPVWAVDGSPCAVLGHDGHSIWVRVFRWVEGTPYDWQTVDPEVSRRVGALVAALHALPVPAADLEEAQWQPLGRETWESLAHRATDSDVPWAGLLREKLPDVIEWEEHILSHTVTDEPFAPSQRDLHPPNIIRPPDGALALVDWDAAGPVLAREEVAGFALVWATGEDQSINAEAVRAFIDGYRAAGGRFRSRGIFDFTLRQRALLGWIAFNVRRHLDEIPGPYPWLTGALLEHLRPLNVEELSRMARLLDV